MKLLKTLTLGVLAAASVGSASAQTVIHIAGSTAFRAPATAAICDYLNNSATIHAATNGTALLGGGAALIANGTIGSGGTASIIVETYWTGSLAGVVDVVAGNNTGAYIDASGMTSAQISTFNTSTVSSAYVTSDVSLTPTNYVTSAPDAAFSDSYQGTISKEVGTGAQTGTIGSYSSISLLATACAGSSIVDAGTTANTAGTSFGFVGIVPFEWVLGNVSDSSIRSAISNISQQTTRGLIQNGFIPQSYLTGGSGSGDTGNYMYLVGRNEDSGTRIGAMSESQYGVTTGPKQFQVATGTLTTELYPITALNTEPNIVWNTAGHSGYAGGSNVAAAIDIAEGSGSTTFGSLGGKAPNNSGASYFIGYLGITDAISAVTGGGKALTYGGVGYSVPAVQNGSYTFWTYEHLYRLSGLTGTKLSTVNNIADLIYATDADLKSDGSHDAGGGNSAGILDSPTAPVLVYRSAFEGGPLSDY